MWIFIRFSCQRISMENKIEREIAHFQLYAMQCTALTV